MAGPKEESRTTEAMRKFVQEEEERLFLEKSPLRAKVQVIGTTPFAVTEEADLADVYEVHDFTACMCEMIAVPTSGTLL